MILRGDFAGMRRMAEKLKSLATVPAAAASKGATKLEELVEAEYAEGQDPAGKPWVPLAPATRRRGRTPPPLTASGAMRGETKVVAKGTTIEGSSPHPAELHESGTRHMPARPIAPNAAALPPRWAGALTASADEAARELLEGK